MVTVYTSQGCGNFRCAYSKMDNMKFTVSLDQLRLFHNIDRQMYTILVTQLGRNPFESLLIMGLWLWLERLGLASFIGRILSLPPLLIDEFAEEAVSCLKCLSDQSPFPLETYEIPLTQSLMKKDISLLFFQEHRLYAWEKLQDVMNKVCLPALLDLIEKAQNGSLAQSLTETRIMTPFVGPSSSSMNEMREPQFSSNVLPQDFSNLNISGISPPPQGPSQDHETFVHDRTMFITFSKGYPVSELELRRFFTRPFGDCIESLYMQEVDPGEQSLFAKVMFFNSSYIDMILKGIPKAKFSINGKHVWMRKFVPKNAM